MKQKTIFDAITQIPAETYKKLPRYTRERLLEIIKGSFKDYKDPTEGMSDAQRQEFYSLMKESLNKPVVTWLKGFKDPAPDA